MFVHFHPSKIFKGFPVPNTARDARPKGAFHDETWPEVGASWKERHVHGPWPPMIQLDRIWNAMELRF